VAPKSNFGFASSNGVIGVYMPGLCLDSRPGHLEPVPHLQEIRGPALPWRQIEICPSRMTGEMAGEGGEKGLPWGWILLGLAAAGVSAGVAGYVFGKSGAERKALEEEVRNPAVLREQDLDAFQGPVVVSRAPSDEVNLRYTCGPERSPGMWQTPEIYTDSTSAREALALPRFNCANTASRVRIPAGTPRATGTVAPAFGRAGGGCQVLVRRTDLLTFD